MSKMALLVGINGYWNGNVLNGCLNNVDDMHRTITSIGLVGKKDIVTLTDDDATTANIKTQLELLVEAMSPGDYGMFYFSGHGSQIADKDGDEADGKDELICPVDMDWAKGLYITDDVLGGIIGNVPRSAWLEVILDSCHSGTATRSIVKGMTEKTIPSPHANMQLPVSRMRKALGGSGSGGQGNHVLWSGCMDNQSSWETTIGGKSNGIFTYFLASAWRNEPHQRRYELLNKARDGIKRRGFDQDPQLTIVTP